MSKPLPALLSRSLPPRLRVRIFKEPASAWTHFAGFLAALVAAAVLVRGAAHDRPKEAGMAIYGAALVALFLASSLYHFFDIGERGNRWLRRLDHAAIFLLIGGTAVPLLLHLLDGTTRIVLLGVIGGFAIVGTLLKVLWIDSPSWIGMTLYFGMSFAAVIPGHRMLPQLSGGELALLVGGGLAYSIGAVVYARRWPDPWPERFGHHEVWHLFVLAGAAAHYALNYSLLDFTYPPL
ncbi:MAG: hemolysin III family protein [Deltaproteobacteria bacterium]|nr:hemolysin III family protein [Deltaproteobacteria bacterium]